MTPTGDGDTLDLIITVEEGYEVDIWELAGPRNMTCLDDTNPDHFTRPGCNFWYFSNIKSYGNGTITATAASRAQVEQGYVLYMAVVEGMSNAIAAEDCGSLTIRGVTTNG
jgi:hypothetical protein